MKVEITSDEDSVMHRVAPIKESTNLVSGWERGDRPRQNTIENSMLVEYTSYKGEPLVSSRFSKMDLFESLSNAMYEAGEVIAAGIGVVTCHFRQGSGQGPRRHLRRGNTIITMRTRHRQIYFAQRDICLPIYSIPKAQLPNLAMAEP
jgi:hypothetical protein